MSEAIEVNEIIDEVDASSVTEEVEEVSEAVEPSQSAEISSADECERLRSEVARLEALLAEKREADDRVMRELSEFSRLFPDVSVRSVPDGVWRSVEGGLPLSAAYALFEREQALLSRRASEVNAKNASVSAGSAGASAPPEYFSPDEVRAMSAREVHENYQIIRNSMKHWR